MPEPIVDALSQAIQRANTRVAQRSFSGIVGSPYLSALTPQALARPAMAGMRQRPRGAAETQSILQAVRQREGLLPPGYSGTPPMFVQRMADPNAPVAFNNDGSVSTHRMSYGEADGRYFVFPTLREENGRLIEDDDPARAFETGNVLWFDTEEEARNYASGGWKPAAVPQRQAVFR